MGMGDGQRECQVAHSDVIEVESDASGVSSQCVDDVARGRRGDRRWLASESRGTNGYECIAGRLADGDGRRDAIEPAEAAADKVFGSDATALARWRSRPKLSLG